MKTFTGLLENIQLLDWMKQALCRLVIFCLSVCCAYAWEPSQDFTTYIKQCEGYRSMPYHCPAGQLTVGYGHAVKSGEFFVAVSEIDASEILRNDLKAAYASVSKQIGFEPYGKTAEMLVDFQFNIGTLKKFPKLTKACIKNDMAGVSQEYKRFAGGHELTGRNNAFYKRFVKN
jgi:lysozyme